MKSLFSLLIFFISINFLIAQPYQIGHTTINFIDSSRSNRSIPTEIYYPSDFEGDNVSITNQNTSLFPVLVFGHGFLAPWDVYQNFWEVLVPQGYIMVFPKTETTISISHLEYAKDFSFLIDQMNDLGSTMSSLFYNRVSSMNCVMGHSMGGGSSFLAVPLNSEIKTLVNFAATETVPSAIEVTPSISIPTLVFGGTLDCITPPITNQIPLYNGLGSNCKTYISITGGNHCQMANTNLLCSSGELFCIPPTITRSQQHTTIFNYLLPWLDNQLKQDCNQGVVFDTLLNSDSSTTYLKNCNQCLNLSAIIGNDPFFDLKIYPNPSTNFIRIESSSEERFYVKIRDVVLKEIFSGSFKKSISVDVSELSSGYYFVEIQDETGKEKKSKFVKI